MKRWILVAFVCLALGLPGQASDQCFKSGFCGSAGSGGTGLIGTTATLQTVEYLNTALSEFTGLSQDVPWYVVYADPYCGSDGNDGSSPICGLAGSGKGPILSLQEAKARTKFGVRMRFRNDGIWSPLTFAYSANRTGECLVGETVTYNTSLKARILAIVPEHDVIVFESLRPANPATAFDDLDNADTPTGDISGCTWSNLTGKTDTMGNYAGELNSSGIPTALRERIVMLWESWPRDDYKRARFSCDRINTTGDPDGFFYSESAGADSGYFGVQNLWVDGCAIDVISNDSLGKVRVLNVKVDSLQADSATGNSTVTAPNINCATIHGGGRVDVLNLECKHQGPAGNVTTGAPIAFSSDGGNSEYIQIGGSIHHDHSLATAGNPVHISSTGGKHVVVGTDAHIVGTGTVAMDGFILKNTNADSEHYLALNLSRGNDIAGSGALNTRDETTNFTNVVRSYQNTFHNFRDRHIVDSSVNPARVDLLERGDLYTDSPGFIIRQLGSSSCAQMSVDIEGLYDDTGNGDWQCNGVSYNTAALAQAGDCGVLCGWDLYEQNSVNSAGTNPLRFRFTGAVSASDADNSFNSSTGAFPSYLVAGSIISSSTFTNGANNLTNVAVVTATRSKITVANTLVTESAASRNMHFPDPRLACDQATPGVCFEAFDTAWTIPFPHCLYDYLPTPICSLTGGGTDRNIGAR